MPKFTDIPIDKVVKQANERMHELANKGHYSEIHQKWTCKHCGSRQTMAEKNVFHRSGICEECKQLTIIQKCNYLFIIGRPIDLPNNTEGLKK